METQGRLMGNNFVPLDAARVLKIYTEFISRAAESAALLPSQTLL